MQFGPPVQIHPGHDNRKGPSSMTDATGIPKLRDRLTRPIGTALLGLVMASTSCRTADFYSQAVGGQLEVFATRRPVTEVVANTDDAQLKERLILTQRLLVFARDHLDMPSKGSFEQYADLKREHLVWVLHAAPELSLEPKRWWYPVIGCQDYRGYFSAERADEERKRIESTGLESWTTKVDAYSTLGFFRDPLLNTYITREETDLAELIFHELTHQKYYVHGSTPFNEAMAEAVAREAVRQWFRHTGRPKKLKRYEARLGRMEQARVAIEQCIVELEKTYVADLSDDSKRLQKSRAISALKSRLRELRGEWGYGLDSWINDGINNARLNAFTTYEQDVPRFTRLMEECHGDFPMFWEKVKELKP